MQSVDVKAVLTGIRPGGCVQEYLESFGAELISAGYTLFSARDYIRSGAHLGRWMDLCNVRMARLKKGTIRRFAQHKCDCPGVAKHGQRPSRRTVARARQFIEHLVRVGIVPPLEMPVARPLPFLLIGFRAWMTHHRGAKDRTIDRYERLIEEMLPALGSEPAAYEATLVRQAVLRTVRKLSPGYAKDYVCALRAFLRFLAAQGRCRSHLDRAVPIVPQWRLSALPRHLETQDVERVIASCDLSKPCGVRDRAILLLLARLGLRAGDITAMRLDHIDWHAGTVRVLGKGRKEVCLPFPQDAGEALLEYLVKCRPRVDSDRVFLCADAPVRPFAGSSSISDIVRFALQRAGIQDPPSKGAHLLRHSAATAMLRSGASLDMIATVLRHESSDTTAYYAKVDIELLRQIAQPWPEGTFLREYLPRDQGRSEHTCDAYAYSFQLLLCFAAERHGTSPSALVLEQLEAPLVLAFLEHLETGRGNSPRTRNARLAAIRAFAHFIEYRVPSAIEQVRRILAIPSKKRDEALVDYLNRHELQTVLDAPDPTTRSGTRDRAMLHVCFAGGLRLSELIGLRLDDVQTHPDASIRVHGKGRRERVLPLWKETAKVLRAWVAVRGQSPASELFLNAQGHPLTRSGFEYILEKHVKAAATICPSISSRRVSPHVLRHTCAMHTLQATHDVRKVSLWLGHASVKSTEIYLRADPTEKLEALQAGVAPSLRRGRFQAPDKLLEMVRSSQKTA